MENQKTMAEMLEMYEDSFNAPKRGSVIKGKVILVTDSEVVVNIGYKSDGIVPKSEVSGESVDLKSTYQPDQEIDVMVVKNDDGQGNVLLSIKRLSILKEWEVLEKLFEEEKQITVNVKDVTKGGVVAYYNEVRGFIPASQLSHKFVKNLNVYVGKDLDVSIIEINRQKRKLVFSHKDIAHKQHAEKMADFWKNINEGDIVEGEVKRIADFGVFVDIGGFDGLVHLTELTWGRNRSPKAHVKIGDKVNVKVLSCDQEKDRISLSLKQTQPEPWSVFENNFNTEDVVEGRVVNLTDFGAFIELQPGIEGLVHVSQISSERVEKPEDVLKVNDVVNVRILEADVDSRKVKLTMRVDEPVASDNE